MTDTQQILLAVTPAVVPSLLVLVGIFVNNGRFNAIDRRIDDMRLHFDQRFSDLGRIWDEKIARVEGVTDARLRHLEER